MSDLPPPPSSPASGSRPAAGAGSSPGRRKGFLLVVGGLVAVVVAVVAIRLVTAGGSDDGRELTCAPVAASFLPALDLPRTAPAQYARYSTFQRSGGGGTGTIYLVAATVDGRTGVWAVDQDPAAAVPKGIVLVRAPAASTDAATIAPKVGLNIPAGAYQRGVPSSEAAHASTDTAAVEQIQGCL